MISINHLIRYKDTSWRSDVFSSQCGQMCLLSTIFANQQKCPCYKLLKWKSKKEMYSIYGNQTSWFLNMLLINWTCILSNLIFNDFAKVILYGIPSCSLHYKQFTIYSQMYAFITHVLVDKENQA